MTRRGVLTFVVLLVAAGAVAFYLGRAGADDGTMTQMRGGGGWLRNAPREVVEAERQFEQQTRQLTDSVRVEQVSLSTMLADANCAGEEILAQANRVVESYATVLRTVGRHLAQLQGSLPQSQMRSLLQSCAGSIRGQMQRRYRWRGGALEGDRGGGYRGGRGDAGIRGRGGPGFGRQYRGGAAGGRGFVVQLRLTEEQAAWIEQQDPDFDQQIATLKNRLSQTHADLAASLEAPQIDGESLLARVEDLIQAYSDLEIRVAQHLVLLRPRLSDEQRQRLSELCGRGSGP